MKSAEWSLATRLPLSLKFVTGEMFSNCLAQLILTHMEILILEDSGAFHKMSYLSDHLLKRRGCSL